MRNGVDNTPGRQHKGHISLRLLFLPSLYPSYDRPFAHGPGLTVDGVELVIRGPPLNTGRLIIVWESFSSFTLCGRSISRLPL